LDEIVRKLRQKLIHKIDPRPTRIKSSASGDIRLKDTSFAGHLGRHVLRRPEPKFFCVSTWVYIAIIASTNQLFYLINLLNT
jgi:hypothetical protein